MNPNRTQRTVRLRLQPSVHRVHDFLPGVPCMVSMAFDLPSGAPGAAADHWAGTLHCVAMHRETRRGCRVHTCGGSAGALQPVDFVVFEDGELAVLAHPAGKLGLRRLRRVRKLVEPTLRLVERPVCLRREPGVGFFARRLLVLHVEEHSVSQVTFWHLAEQKKVDRHRLHRSRPLVLPQLLQSAGGGASVECIFVVSFLSKQRFEVPGAQPGFGFMQ